MSNEKSATPYELRLEMIKMSKDFLESQFDIQREAVMRSYTASIDYATRMNQAVPKMPEMPKFPTLEEITKTAEQFNQFVSGTFKK